MFYYVNRNTDTQGNHEVHKQTCHRLPTQSNRVDLGFFGDAQDAVEKAREHYPTADGCYHCCPEAHRE